MFECDRSVENPVVILFIYLFDPNVHCPMQATDFQHTATYCASVSHITPLSLSSHIINYLQISMSFLCIYIHIYI